MIAKRCKVNIISLATIRSPQVTDTKAEAFDLTTFLPYRLAVLSERVSARLAVEYGRSHGIGVAEWRVLVHVNRAGSASVRDITRRANLGKPRVSRAVARLETLGLVQKRSGATDGRLVAITLTPAGHATLAEILPMATQVESRLLGALPFEDRQKLQDIMEKLHRVLDADPEATPRTDPELT